MFGFEFVKELFTNKEEIEDTEEKVLNDHEPEVVVIDPNKNNFTLMMDDFSKSNSIDDLVNMYREAAENSEIENAVDEICNESIVLENKKIVSLNLDLVDMSENIKKKIMESFDIVLKILKFNENAYGLFKQWFTDGRIYLYLKLKDPKNKNKNENENENEIVGYEILQPTKIKKVKEKDTDKYFYLYEKNEHDSFKIDPDLIIFIHSGITDPKDNYYISYLHKSLKPLNQLRLLEDSSIIYRITRAPERRVFYIDVGKLSKRKAEAYLQKMMNKFRNKVSYDVATGKVTNQKNVMTMLEDFYFPVTEGGRGTKVETLQGGQSLSDMQDIFYFKKKLYKSLKIPLGRIDDDATVVDIGRTGEMTREELKFTKFSKRLQSQFGKLLFELLKRQLIWSNIFDKNDWNNTYQEMFLKWNVDSYFATLKAQELFKAKLEIIAEMGENIGKYFSNSFVNKKVLEFSDEEIENMKKEIEDEKASGEIPPEEEEE